MEDISIAGPVAQVIISVLIPVVLIIYLHRKKWLSWKAIGVGALTFVVFALILEQISHAIVLDPSGSGLKWTDNPYVYMLYASLAAGIFEEVGRFISIKLLLKSSRSFGDGLSLGAGHGGTEAILVTAMSGISAIATIQMIQSGALESSLAAQLNADQIQSIKDQFSNASFWEYILGAVERIFAVTMHLAFSLLVLLGVVKKQWKYIVYAVLYHAFVDSIAVAYQVGFITNIWVVEGILFILSISALVLIFKLKDHVRPV